MITAESELAHMVSPVGWLAHSPKTWDQSYGFAKAENVSRIFFFFLKENLPLGLIQPADASCRAGSLLPGSFQGLPSNHKAKEGPAFLQGWWDLSTQGRVSGSQEEAQTAISGWDFLPLSHGVRSSQWELRSGWV